MKTILHVSLLFSVLTLFVRCAKPDALQGVREGDFSMVRKGAYRARLVFLAEGREYSTTVEHLRAMIERNIDVLDLLSERLYAEPHFGYRFKFAAIDSANDILVLRYFARMGDHPVYAGYQMQLLFDIGSQQLLRIYTCEVPLE